jgi:predicted aldo/keto reductase-like oxidoreductase
MEPIRGGMLSKKPPESITRVWQTASHYRTQAEWALLWVWNQPEISVALSGMSTIDQVIEDVAIADRSGTGILSTVDLSLLDKVRDTYKGLNPVPCTKCRYCMPCPNKVDIPEIFEIYNDSVAFDVIDTGRFRYNGPFSFKDNNRADSCVECGKCMEACPQKIKIPEWLKKVHAELYQPAKNPPG